MGNQSNIYLHVLKQLCNFPSITQNSKAPVLIESKAFHGYNRLWKGTDTKEMQVWMGYYNDKICKWKFALFCTWND